MEKKNYTLDCKWVGEVNSENIKEMAKVMVWNCCPCTYKDDEVTAVASASPGMDGKPHTMNVIIDGKHYNYNLGSNRVSEKMGNEIVDNILKAVAEYKAEKHQTQEDKENMDTKKIAKAMAKCFVKHQTQEVGNYKFEFVSTDGRGVEWVKINVYKNGTLLFSPRMMVYADHHLHPEKLYNRCEEWFSCAVLKILAKNSELEGTELYDYLSTKCVEEGISIDILDKHSEDILK